MASRQELKSKERRMGKLADARKRAEEHESGFRPTAFDPGRLSVFTWGKKGVFFLDVLGYEITKPGNPYVKPGFWSYERTFFQHPRIGSEGGFGSAYCCLRANWGESCPICDYRFALEADAGTDPNKLAIIDALKVKERQIMLVVVRDTKEYGGNGQLFAKGVQVYDGPNANGLGQVLDNKIALSQESEGYRDFFDADNGFRLRVEVSEELFKGKSWYKPYAVEFRQRDPLEEEFFAAATPDILDSMLIRTPYKDLQEIFLQGGTIRKYQGDKTTATASPNGAPIPKDDQPEPGANVDNGPEEDSDKTSAFQISDMVSFEYRGKTRTGDIVAINAEQKIAKVKCSDKNDPYVVSLIELTLIGPDATADADKTTTAGGDEWDAAPASAFTEGDRVLIHSKPQWGGCYLVQRHGDRWRVEEEKTAAQHDNVPESAMTLAKETESKNAPTPDVDDWDDPVPESKPAAPTAPAPSSSADGWDEPDEAPPPRGETRVRISGKK